MAFSIINTLLFYKLSYKFIFGYSPVNMSGVYLDSQCEVYIQRFLTNPGLPQFCLLSLVCYILCIDYIIMASFLASSICYLDLHI